MSNWLMSIGWLRFTVPSSTVEIVKRVLGEGDWIRDEKGYEGYREVWICRGNDSGFGRIATGAKRAPREVHVDLSQELISHWTFEKFHQLAAWVFDQKGHFGRIDVAFDDRLGVIDVDGVYEAVAKGHCVSHFRQCQIIGGLDVPTGADRGKTLALGSRQSESYLRIYDKAAEQRAKEKPVEGPWMRWEMEWKRERAQAVGLALSTLDQDSFQRYIVGVFRTAVDFRDCTRADDPKDRYYAPILGWWKTLTEGMARAKLAIVQAVKTIEQVKRWLTSIRNGSSKHQATDGRVSLSGCSVAKQGVSSTEIIFDTGHSIAFSRPQDCERFDSMISVTPSPACCSSKVRARST